jgi:hypothetical protein
MLGMMEQEAIEDREEWQEWSVVMRVDEDEWAFLLGTGRKRGHRKPVHGANIGVLVLKMSEGSLGMCSCM